MYVYIYIYMYIYIYICIYMYIYMYICIHSNFNLSKTSITQNKPTVPAELLYEQVVNNFDRSNFGIVIYFQNSKYVR